MQIATSCTKVVHVNTCDVLTSNIQSNIILEHGVRQVRVVRSADQLVAIVSQRGRQRQRRYRVVTVVQFLRTKLTNIFYQTL